MSNQSEKKQIDAMEAILYTGKMGPRNRLIFSIGINTAYRISDLRQLKLSDILTIFRGRLIAKECLDMKNKMTGKHNYVIISDGYFLFKNGTDIEIIQEFFNHSSKMEILYYIGIKEKGD